MPSRLEFGHGPNPGEEYRLREINLSKVGKYRVDSKPLYGYGVLISTKLGGATIKINERWKVNGDLFADNFKLLDVRGDIVKDPEIELFMWGRVSEGPHKGKLLVSITKRDSETEVVRNWDVVVPADRLVSSRLNPLRMTFKKEESFEHLHNRRWGEEE